MGFHFPFFSSSAGATHHDMCVPLAAKHRDSKKGPESAFFLRIHGEVRVGKLTWTEREACSRGRAEACVAPCRIGKGIILRPLTDEASRPFPGGWGSTEFRLEKGEQGEGSLLVLKRWKIARSALVPGDGRSPSAVSRGRKMACFGHYTVHLRTLTSAMGLVSV